MAGYGSQGASHPLRSNGYEMHIMIVIDLVTFVVVTPGNKPDADRSLI